MGTPRYRDDMSGTVKEAKRNKQDLFSLAAALTPEGRPYTTLGVCNTNVGNMPSTTLDTFASLQIVSGFRTHPKVALYIRVYAPAGYSEVRVTDAGDGTVLYGPGVPGGTGWRSMRPTITLPSSLDIYEEFRLNIEARSLVAGETTYLNVGYAVCRP